MPIFRDARGIIGGQWCSCQQTRPHHSRPNPFQLEINITHRYAGIHPSDRRHQATFFAPSPKMVKLCDHEASPRDHVDITAHPTHWPAADKQDFPRMRSGCASARLPVIRVIPWLVADTRRMRGEDGR
jgi:hypothetical protein